MRQIKRHKAEERIKTVLAGSRDPGAGSLDDEERNDDEHAQMLDVEQAARDQLPDNLRRKFAGRRLPDVVDALLRTQGYLTRARPPGPHGGVNILDRRRGFA